MNKGAAAAADEPELRTVDGRVPGRRGRETRRKLLEVTAEMLRTRSYREIAVVDIARESGVSPATFYQYFPDVETAIFFIADRIAEDGNRRLSELVEAIDIDGDCSAGADALALGFLELWREYRSILRILDLGAAERDDRFQQRRTELLAGPTEALQRAVAGRQASGRLTHDIDPAAFAAVLTAMLSHVAAHRPGLRAWGVSQDDLVAAMSRIITMSLTDRAPTV